MKKADFISCPICDSSSSSIVTFRFDSDRIVQCSNCGHVYLNPVLTDSQLEAIYKKYHVSEDEDSYIKTVNGWISDPKGPYQYFLSLIDGSCGFKGKRLLDIGCGTGCFLFECSNRGAVVTGVDSSLKAVQLAKKYFNLDIIPKSLEEAVKEGDLLSSGFDMVTAFEVIEHVRKPTEFLSFLYRLLAPGGLVFVSTPNFHLYYSMGSSAPSLTGYSEHIHFFDVKSLTNCFERCHYDVINVTTLNPMAYGQRKKHVFANVSIVKNAWQRMRHIGAVRGIKDSIFRTLDKHIDKTDRMGWNGASLLGAAQKPVKAD